MKPTSLKRPYGALPVMEGKAMLFKHFAGIDAVPIVLDVHTADEIVNAVLAIAPSFGGINLEDIAAPICFEVTKRSKVRRNYLTYMRARTGKSARMTGVDFDKSINDVRDEEAEKAEAEAKAAVAAEAEAKAAEKAKEEAELEAKAEAALKAHDAATEEA